MEARTENRVSRIEEVCKWMAAMCHDAEPLGTVRLIFQVLASREKTLAPTAALRERNQVYIPNGD